MSFDYITYALLKKKISSAAGGIQGAKVENGHLIIIGADGIEYDCGDLGIPTIDDAATSTSTIWSSQKIVDYHNEHSAAINETQIRAIALDVTEDALGELMPSAILGGYAGESLDIIDGGRANTAEKDTLYGMDADEEPISIDITLEEE